MFKDTSFYILTLLLMLLTSNSNLAQAEVAAKTEADQSNSYNATQDEPMYLDDAVLTAKLGQPPKNDYEDLVIDPSSLAQNNSYHEAFNQTLKEVNSFSAVEAKIFKPTTGANISGASDVATGLGGAAPGDRS